MEDQLCEAKSKLCTEERKLGDHIKKHAEILSQKDSNIDYLNQQLEVLLFSEIGVGMMAVRDRYTGRIEEIFL